MESLVLLHNSAGDRVLTNQHPPEMLARFEACCVESSLFRSCGTILQPSDIRVSGA